MGSAYFASLLTRMVAGLALGLIAGAAIWQRGMVMMYLVALGAGVALLSIGLGLSRFLVAAAIWLGQYAVFFLKFYRPKPITLDAEAPRAITNGIFVFMPAMALIVGAYGGLLFERARRIIDKRAEDASRSEK